MASGGQPSIFVAIASYRDTECQWTVKDLFEKATCPDRIFVGICWQFVPGEDDDCFQVTTRPEQCRVLEFHARDSQGACWARHQGQKLWQGEDYVLQIDSHMRFVPGWDERLLEMLAACPSERAVLSTYPPAYVPPNDLAPESVTTIHPKHFDTNGVLMFGSTAVPVKDAPAVPVPSPYVAAGMLFGPGAIIEEVPYDPYLYFQGEEITLAVRLWTSGWDIFIPNKVVAWHDYTKRPGRRRHWDDSADSTKLSARAYARVRVLLGMEGSTDPDVLQEIGRYGLGTRRSLQDYEAFAKLDFSRRLIDGRTFEQIEAQRKPAERRRHSTDVFSSIWKTNGWGNAETRSGSGSTLAQTRVLRDRLPRLLRFLGVRSLTDAGCGDFNWMRQITGDLRHYFGFDIVDGLVDDLRQRFGERKNHFFNTADVVYDQLPEADAILCRDCLTHLPDDLVLAALRRFKASGARHLIATTFPAGRNDPIRTGGWRPINLVEAPFSLPPPSMLLSEELANSTKALGVWTLADLPE